MELKKFDYKLKESKKKPIIIALIIVIVLLIGITIYFTYAAYKVTNSYNILEGNVDFFEKRDVTIAVKLVDEEGNITYTEEFPEEGYVFDSEKSYCINGAKITYSNGSATISEVDGKDKCTLYFKVGLSNVIQAHAKENNYLYTTTPDFSKATTDGEYGLYSAEDDYGTSYYFRGDVENNYVKFGTYQTSNASFSLNGISTFTTLEACESGRTDGGYTTPCLKVGGEKGDSMYWRIVRVNGDGTIRLAYAGTELLENGTEHVAAIPGGECGSIEYKNSTSKQIVDKWYEKHLATTYNNYISDTIFCNDTEEISRKYYDYNLNEITDISSGYDVTEIYYGASSRLSSTSLTPKLTCTSSADKYTINSNIGNGLLSYPIGLITADEVLLAGKGKNNYLYSSQSYLTMTPYMYFDYYAGLYIYGVESGDLSNDVTGMCSSPFNDTRPVINLKADVDFTGTGTITDPYEIVIK